jgi:AcrR family transcriptional regulator
VAEAKLDTQIRQEQIVEAAMSLVAEQGLRRLSVGAVARRVGLVPSGIYRHFKNKAELIDAMLGQVEQRMLANVRASREEHTDALDCLKDVLMRHIRFLREGKVLSVPRMVFAEDVYAGHPDRKRRVLRVLKQYMGQVADVVRLGQSQGSIRSDIDPQTVAMMLFGIVVPAGIFWHLTDGGFDVTRHAQRAWRLFVAAVKSTANPPASQ